MSSKRPLHPDFLELFREKEEILLDLFLDLRDFLLDLAPDSNELLYRTHALSAVFSFSDKLSDAFCHIPVYEKHLNLGFNRGSMLEDPENLLSGKGKWTRHIRITQPEDYRNDAVRDFVRAAMAISLADQEGPSTLKGATILRFQ